MPARTTRTMNQPGPRERRFLETFMCGLPHAFWGSRLGLLCEDLTPEEGLRCHHATERTLGLAECLDMAQAVRAVVGVEPPRALRSHERAGGGVDRRDRGVVGDDRVRQVRV